MKEDVDFMKNDKNTGSQLELTSLMTEYENQFDRSNKLDNKVYITITFCGFLFVFIIGLFNGISQLVKPQDRLQLFVSVLYILSCIAVMGAYAYVLVIALYRETVNGNLVKLHHRCDEFVKGLKFIVPTVLLAFVCYALQIILQIAW